VRIGQTVVSGSGMSFMNVFPCIYTSGEEHGNPTASLASIAMLTVGAVDSENGQETTKLRP